ncbi:hypothetical protein [Streptomyces sp. NPDC056405]|uniref:hypothetical protein n=1 Tax=Streptomyces sp. NPDC056405 TaxID=3345811 RepID=UPI0035DCC7E4
MEQLPTTQAAVTALRAIAVDYALEIDVTDDIGADQTSRRKRQLPPEGDALITVENVSTGATLRPASCPRSSSPRG